MIFNVTPITPNDQIERLAGFAFMIRWQRPDQLEHVLRLGAYVRFENGAFGIFKAGLEAEWPGYYRWIEPHLFHPGRDAIIPDVIGAGTQLQDALKREWPFGHKGLPVYHTDEPIGRLIGLFEEGWPRVAIGATGEHWQIWKTGRAGEEMTNAFRQRADEILEALMQAFGCIPPIHFLRGVAVRQFYPEFEDADSSSVGQNAHRHRKKPMPLFPDLCGGVDYARKLQRTRR